MGLQADNDRLTMIVVGRGRGCRLRRGCRGGGVRGGGGARCVFVRLYVRACVCACVRKYQCVRARTRVYV